MLDTIKSASSSGDKLFVIGEAHREKLRGEIEGLGLTSRLDTQYLEVDKGKNDSADRPSKPSAQPKPKPTKQSKAK